MKTKSRILTLQQLRDVRACDEQVELFKQHFGDSVRVTVARAKKFSTVFNFDFAARHFLSTAARKVYEDTRAAAWKVYKDTCAPALKVCDDTRAREWKVYKDTYAAARKVCDDACAAARKVCDDTRAAAFATVYINLTE